MTDNVEKPADPVAGRTAEEKIRSSAEESHDHGPEQELWRGRGDWRYQIGSIALFVIVGIASVIVIGLLVSNSQNKTWMWWVAGIVTAALGLKAAWNVIMHVYQTRYRLTSERLFIDRGILSRTTDQIELIRVDDVRVRQRVLDRLFLIGSIDILSTDVSDAKVSIIGIQKPDEVAEHIRSHMRSLRKKSLFIENL